MRQKLTYTINRMKNAQEIKHLEAELKEAERMIDYYNKKVKELHQEVIVLQSIIDKIQDA